jgi:hypothetical protein
VASDDATATLHGGKFIAAIKQAGIDYVLSVPDITTAGGLLAPIAADNSLQLVRVSKEDECLGIAMGLAMCDKRALILIQHTGLLDSVNALGGVAVEFKPPHRRRAKRWQDRVQQTDCGGPPHHRQTGAETARPLPPGGSH